MINDTITGQYPNPSPCPAIASPCYMGYELQHLEHVQSRYQNASRRFRNKTTLDYQVLKMAGIESVFDLAISIPHQLIEDGGGMLTGADEHIALGLVMKSYKKGSPVDSGIALQRFFHCSGNLGEKTKSTQIVPQVLQRARFLSEGRYRELKQ